MPTFSLQEFLLRLASIVIIAALHGFFTTLTARRLGDHGPAFEGRLTLNPFPHIDIVGGILMLLFRFGWTRPVMVSTGELRRPRRDYLILAILPSLALLASLLGLRALRPLSFSLLPSDAALTFGSLVTQASSVGLAFVILNALPVPPLAGRYFLFAIAPNSVRRVDRLDPYAKVGLAVFIGLGAAASLLGPIAAWLGDRIWIR